MKLPAQLEESGDVHDSFPLPLFIEDGLELASSEGLKGAHSWRSANIRAPVAPSKTLSRKD